MMLYVNTDDWSNIGRESCSVTSHRNSSAEQKNCSSGVVSQQQQRKNKKAFDFRARHWSYLFETLRRTVDAIYETCRTDRSIIECKEAHLILTRCAKDFESLINCLNVEDSWAQSEKPTAVAWEIRKTVGSPNKPLTPQLTPHEKPTSKKETVDTTCSSSSINKDVNVKKENVEDKGLINESQLNSVNLKEETNKCTTDDDNKDQSKNNVSEGLDTGVMEEQQKTDRTEEEGWSLVNSKGRRRRRVKSQSQNSTGCGAGTGSWREMTGGNFMNPRTAMDIPQTKASMAKMAYSRQLLWEKKQRELQEKLFAQHRSHHQHQPPRRAGSFPSLNKIGINFADPRAVTRSAKALRATMEQKRRQNSNGGLRKGKYRGYQSVESLHSLERKHP